MGDVMIDIAELPKPKGKESLDYFELKTAQLVKPPYYPVHYNRDPSLIDRLGQEIKKSNAISGQVIVVPSKKGGYEVIFGYEWIEAAKDIGLTRVNGYICHYEKEMAVSTCYALNLPTLSIVEQALTVGRIAQYMSEYNKTQLADLLGFHLQYITDFRRIRKMSDRVKRAIQQGLVNNSSARLLAYQKPLIQEKAIEQVEAGNLRTFLQIKDFITGKKAQSSKRDRKEAEPQKPEKGLNQDDVNNWHLGDDNFSLRMCDEIGSSVGLGCEIRYAYKLDFKKGGAFTFKATRIQVLTGVIDRLEGIESDVEWSINWEEGQGKLVIKFDDLDQQDIIFKGLCGFA